METFCQQEVNLFIRSLAIQINKLEWSQDAIRCVLDFRIDNTVTRYLKKSVQSDWAEKWCISGPKRRKSESKNRIKSQNPGVRLARGSSCSRNANHTGAGLETRRNAGKAKRLSWSSCAGSPGACPTGWRTPSATPCTSPNKERKRLRKKFKVISENLQTSFRRLKVLEMTGLNRLTIRGFWLKKNQSWHLPEWDLSPSWIAW